MELNLDYSNGQTPLDEEEKEGLLLPAIATRGELNEFEQQNIEQAVLWSLNRSFKSDAVFTEQFLKALHKRMYGNVWAWAGEFRRSDKNIGVDRWHIPIALRSLLDDVSYWHANNIYSVDERTLRFKHRLVSIHCFANGNGRHSRLVADIVIEKIYGQPQFTWGTRDLTKQDDPRKEYLNAVKAADKGDIQSLISFARS